VKKWAIAGLVWVCFTALVMSTTDMGFTRDEGFYFKYSEVYTNWFVRLWRAETAQERDKLLSRKEVKATWSQNFEHPPLMKVLFGASWRFLGEKRRPIRVAPDGRFSVESLGVAHGFDVGDEVVLLRPTFAGGDPDDSGREIGRGTIEARSKGSAQGAVASAEAGAKRSAQDTAASADAGYEGSAQGAAASADAGTKGSAPGAAASDEVDGAEFSAICVETAESAEKPWRTRCEARTTGLLQVFSESDAYRFPGALMGGLLMAALFLLAEAFAGLWTALLSVLLMAFIPQPFFHAHLTCFDVPITALCLATLYAFYRSLSSTGWAVATGFVWGLALLTKNNAFFIPISLVVWWVVFVLPKSRKSDQWRGWFPPVPLAFVTMPLIGVPMMFALWPNLWHEPIASFGKYLAFHMHHDHYFQYYYGAAYQRPPFPREFALVLTLLTVPVLTTVLFLVGAVRMCLHRQPSTIDHRPSTIDHRPSTIDHRPSTIDHRPSTMSVAAWKSFVLVNMLLPISLFALGTTPIFGGTKHWLLSMPFLCLVAAFGLRDLLLWAWEGLTALNLPDRAWIRNAAAAAAVMVIIAPAVHATLSYAEYGTSYFNELIGGVRGAADSRMQRQFWSYASRGALDYVNERAPHGIAIDFQDALTTGCEMYKREGKLRHDLKCASRKGVPDLLLFDVEERFSEEEIRDWASMDTVGPIHEVQVDGVPVVRVYSKHAGFAQAEAETNR